MGLEHPYGRLTPEKRRSGRRTVPGGCFTALPQPPGPREDEIALQASRASAPGDLKSTLATHCHNESPSRADQGQQSRAVPRPGATAPDSSSRASRNKSDKETTELCKCIHRIPAAPARRPAAPGRSPGLCRYAAILSRTYIPIAVAWFPDMDPDEGHPWMRPRAAAHTRSLARGDWRSGWSSSPMTRNCRPSSAAATSRRKWSC